MQQVSFSTSDGVEIVGDYYDALSPKAALLLLHMMPSDRVSWRAFAKQASAAGFSILAVDLRGHGESVRREGMNENLDYKKFTDLDHGQSILDVEAAVSFLRQRAGVIPLIFIGASIGGNLALKYAAEHRDVIGVVLLSAGVDYRGVQTIAPARNMSEPQSVYVVATRDDVRSGGPADNQAQQIYDVLMCKKHIQIFNAGGHGTDILSSHPELADQLINWMTSLIT